LAGLAAADRSLGPGVLPQPRLLGAFDPLLHGWVSRDPVLGPHKQVITVNGLFRPFALVGGRAVGLWNLASGRINLEPFAPLADSVTSDLQADGSDVLRFLAR